MCQSKKMNETAWLRLALVRDHTCRPGWTAFLMDAEHVGVEAIV